MYTFEFEGLGTHWSIMVDTEGESEYLSATVQKYCQAFEAHFSRFRPDSEVNAFRVASPGTYLVSETLATLLERAHFLRQETKGAYDPVVGGILELAGYGAQTGVTKVTYGATLPRWSVMGRELSLDGPIAFDFGGIGKGYCIDRIAELLQNAGQAYFLVDGGGDMYGTTKADGKPWRIAIEYPGNPELVVGVVELCNEGLAVSDRFRRRFGTGHHLIDVKQRESNNQILGCAALAPNAFAADCMTSGLSLSGSDTYAKLAEQLEARYLFFPSEGQVIASLDWEGELF